jgi:hypothetical protein
MANTHIVEKSKLYMIDKIIELEEENKRLKEELKAKGENK